MVTTLPYGSWPSPLTADLLATGGTRLGSPRLVGREVWWTEGIATEGGRQAIVRTAGPVALPPAEGAAALSVPADRVTVLPAPYNARSRVHEYGGASWTVVPGARPEPGAAETARRTFADGASGESLPRFAVSGPVTIVDALIGLGFVVAYAVFVARFAQVEED